jgi:hypothetical protein
LIVFVIILNVDCAGLPSKNISRKKDVYIHVVPLNKLITIKNIYPLLGSVNQKLNGYITGIIDQLCIKNKPITARKFSPLK